MAIVSSTSVPVSASGRLLRTREKVLHLAHQADIGSVPRNIRAVLALAGDMRSSASDLARAILADPGLTIQLFKKANSAFFAPGKQQISQMSHLIVLIGLENVMALAVSQPTIPIEGPAFRRLRTRPFFHLLARTSLASFMARSLAPDMDLDPQKAAACCIFKPLGHMILSIAVPRSYEMVWRNRTRPQESDSTARSFTGWTPNELGLFLAQKWNLPTLFKNSISCPQHRIKRMKWESKGLIELSGGLHMLLYLAGLPTARRRLQEKVLDELHELSGLSRKRFNKEITKGLRDFEEENKLLYKILEDQDLIQQLVI